MATLIQKKPEEGGPCRDFFCTGHLHFRLQDDVRCYCATTRAPCSYCENRPLVCDKCGDEVRPDA